MATAVESAMRETFERVDAGASQSYPMQCGDLRVGGYVLIKNEPCKLLSIDISKTGKHGGAKQHCFATNIFSGKKVDMLFMTTDTCQVPVVERKEYQLTYVDDEGFMSLYYDGHPKQDLRLGHDGVDGQIREAYESGMNLLVSVQAAMGKESLIGFREDK